ncbi:MAG: chemotaxis response regulator protein-glutamate methylesterase [Polyangiaceae bacterium]|nr:chemotaxis response regulator protein-glutamate methylesterase [Polyangiaceae bacterium]
MIRVLVVDDSAVYRRLITRMLTAEPGIEVVGYASDPYEARELIVELEPDVVTLDVEMPRMDGLSFLERLMKHRPTPVVLFSTLGQANGEVALRALALGAVEVVAKPRTDDSAEAGAQLRAAVVAAGGAQVAPVLPPQPVARSSVPTSGVVAIGASTGGTRAIEAVLSALPVPFPPIVIGIHMPEGFTAGFAKRLSSVAPFEVREASGQEVLLPGTALVAPAGRHMTIAALGARFQARVFDGPPIRHHRPSIDVLFHSVAVEAGPAALGVLLTGMGQDGAEGLLEMRQRGAVTVAESRETCVVYGMPRVAAELGAAGTIAPLHQIPQVMVGRLRRASLRPQAAS